MQKITMSGGPNIGLISYIASNPRYVDPKKIRTTSQNMECKLNVLRPRERKVTRKPAKSTMMIMRNLKKSFVSSRSARNC